MRRISRGWRAATQPRVKKVALTPACSNRSRTRSVLRSTRRGSFSHASRAITFSKAPTWNQSSTSTERALRIGAPSGGVGAIGCVRASILDPIDQQGQDAAQHRLLFLGARLELGDPPQ